MSDSVSLFQLDDSLSLDQLLAALHERLRLEEQPQLQSTRRYYDSFDWRLYQGDALLYREDDGSGPRLIWSGRDGLHIRETVRLKGEVPRFAWDCPPGLMRDGLAPLLEMRALLPQLELRSQLRTLRLLDGEEKTVLRIRLEQYQARTPGTAEFNSLPGRVRLQPVRGYDKWLKRVQQLLAGQEGLSPVQQGVFEQGLQAIGRRPLDYSSKLDFRFEPELPAQTAARQIHLHLLDTLERNLPGTRKDLDSEFLHDLRVAVRRTRSALTQIKGVFPPAEIERFKSRLAWIGQITGPTRDLDVYLLGFDRYRNSLPAQFRSDLDPLHQFLQEHQKQAQQAMVKRLNSPHFHGLLKEWRAFLEQPLQPADDAPNALRPIKRVADKRIYRTFRRVIDEGQAIHRGTHPDALHELRKQCKKLRYLIEFFQCLYPRQQIRQLIKALKLLLGNLGDFQDLEVQALTLREFAHQMVQEKVAPADTLLAMGMLVDGLLRRQQQARETFDQRFAAFSTPRNQQLFQQLFDGKKNTGKKE